MTRAVRDGAVYGVPAVGPDDEGHAHLAWRRIVGGNRRTAQENPLGCLFGGQEPVRLPRSTRRQERHPDDSVLQFILDDLEERIHAKGLLQGLSGPQEFRPV